MILDINALLVINTNRHIDKVISTLDDTQRDNFMAWKDIRVNIETKFFQWKSEGSAMPLEWLRKNEFTRIIKVFNSNQEYLSSLFEIETDKFNTVNLRPLAETLGLIEYVQSIK